MQDFGCYVIRPFRMTDARVGGVDGWCGWVVWMGGVDGWCGWG